jgi:hypothetical protein
VPACQLDLSLLPRGLKSLLLWGWGPPDNRRKADDSYQALGVGRSLPSSKDIKQ